MKIPRRFISFFLLVVVILSGCVNEPDIKESIPYDSAYYDVSQFYVQYLEFTMHDISKAAQLCFFEDESARELYLAGMQDNLTTSYEIIRFEKLSDCLWVIEVCVINPMHVNGVYFVNYVGIIDNDMMVYRNLRELPTVLTEGLEIEDYKPHGPDILE